MRYINAILWGLCGAICVGFSCVYLLSAVTFTTSVLDRRLLDIVPLVVLIGGSVGLAGLMLQCTGCFTAIVAGGATLLGLVATAITASELDRLFGQSETVFPWYTRVVGIAMGILIGWVMLWTQRSLTTYLRRIRHRS